MDVEAYLNDKSFKYILLNNEGKFFIIRHSISKKFFRYNNEIKSHSVENIKDINDNFKIFNGIIFINVKKRLEEENIKRIKDFISTHNDEIKSKNFFPIIVIGNNIDLLNFKNIKEENIKFVAPIIKINNIDLNNATNEIMKMHNIFYNNINNLIYTKMNMIQNEKKNCENFKKFVQNFIESLKTYLNEKIENIEKEINNYEKILQINNINKYTFDDNFIEQLKNIKLGYFGIVNYNYNASLKEKCNIIFESFKEPIKIITNDLCKDENCLGPFDIINKNIINDNGEKEQVTDLVYLHKYNNKNYFGLSFNNGKLKIYNDDFEKRPIKIFDIFPNERINYLYKSFGNHLIVVGNSKIKKLYISENIEECKVLNEIVDEKQLFKITIEIRPLDILITVNIFNKLMLYDYNNKSIDFTENIFKKKEKEILLIHSIDNYKIILKYRDQAEEIQFLDFNDFEKDTLIINKNQSNDYFWKIIEFEKEENNIKIKKEHLFDKNVNYLGKIKDDYILFFNNKTNIISIFYIIEYYEILSLNFNNFASPLNVFPLGKREEFVDLLFICEKGNLCQYTLNLNMNYIYLISKINLNKIKANNLLDLNKEINNNEIKKYIYFNDRNFLFITENILFYNLKNEN